MPLSRVSWSGKHLAYITINPYREDGITAPWRRCAEYDLVQELDPVVALSSLFVSHLLPNLPHRISRAPKLPNTTRLPQRNIGGRGILES